MSETPRTDVERWQEYDCPISGIDFDLHGSEMVREGDSFYCSGCGQHHTATADLVQQYEMRNGTATVVPLDQR